MVLVMGVHVPLPLFTRLLPGPLCRLTAQLQLQLPSTQQHLAAVFR